jgi:hypothetical protein
MALAYLADAARRLGYPAAAAVIATRGDPHPVEWPRGVLRAAQARRGGLTRLAPEWQGEWEPWAPAWVDMVRVRRAEGADLLVSMVPYVAGGDRTFDAVLAGVREACTADACVCGAPRWLASFGAVWRFDWDPRTLHAQAVFDLARHAGLRDGAALALYNVVLRWQAADEAEARQACEWLYTAVTGQRYVGPHRGLADLWAADAGLTVLAPCHALRDADGARALLRGWLGALAATAAHSTPRTARS